MFEPNILKGVVRIFGKYNIFPLITDRMNLFSNSVYHK